MKANFYNMKNENRYCLGNVVPLNTPFIVVIEPSGFCNLKCIFCPINDDVNGKNLKRSFMEFSLFQKVIDDIKIFGEKIKVLRFIGNGEPLMNKEIIKMITYAKEAAIAKKIEITTNGTLLNEKISKELIDAGLDILKISVEALREEDFFSIAKYKIDMKQYISNIQFFYENKKQCNVYIKINNLAVKSEEDEKLFFKYYGDYADNIFIERISPVWPEFDNNLDLDYKESRFGKSVEKKIACPHIFKSIMICADGEVVPCCADWQRKLNIGNVSQNSMYSIWNGDHLRDLQIAHLKGQKEKIIPCNACLYNEYCDTDTLNGFEKNILKRMEA